MGAEWGLSIPGSGGSSNAVPRERGNGGCVFKEKKMRKEKGVEGKRMQGVSGNSTEWALLNLSKVWKSY